MGLRPRMVVSRDHGRKVTARRRLARFHKLKRVKNASIITTPSLLPVPANADFFIEGPFGGDTGHYTFPEPYPVFHVTAITHRKEAVYPATIVGIPQASVKLFLPIQVDSYFTALLLHCFVSPLLTVERVKGIEPSFLTMVRNGQCYCCKKMSKKQMRL